MTLNELRWDVGGGVVVPLSNGDSLQLIQNADADMYWVFQIDEKSQFNRRKWWRIDALTAQCILNGLLEDPFMQLDNHPER